MSRAILDHVVASSLRKVPDVKPGATVKVYQKITEGEKQRVQMFQGLVISVSAGHGIDKTFTVRKVVEGVGVEKIFPFHSPTIEKIQIMKQGKVRRAKLYYMRDLQGKSTRLRETDLAQSIMDEPKMEDPKADEVVEEPVVEEAVVEDTVAEEMVEDSAPAAEETPAAEPEAEAPAEEEQK
ncbi:MAG: 50S ribosomal protein L19 [Patescibacteria group bacterium]